MFSERINQTDHYMLVPKYQKIFSAYFVILLAVTVTAISELQPEHNPRPVVSGFSAISGVCDGLTGKLFGENYSGRLGTLKACAKRCQQLVNCKGFNFLTDQNKCQLFSKECAEMRTVSQMDDATQNFYLKGEIACSTSTVGNEFYVAFMANRVAQSTNKSLEIWVTQDRCFNDITVTMEFDLSQTLDGTNQPINVKVPYKKAVSTLFPLTWKVSDVDNGLKIEKKALKLSSDTDFVLYAVNKEYFTADAFLGIPSRALGTRYVANCHYPPTYNCEFAFTPTSAGATVSVSLPKSSTATKNFGKWEKAPFGSTKCAILFKGRYYTNGDVIKVTLNEFEVAQIQDPCDLTGTIIESDKPIAIWSGDSKVSVGDSTSTDHVVEQLFPVDTWGTDCVAWPTPRRTDGLVDYWVITAAENGTRVRVDSSETGTSYQALGAGQSVRFPANSVNEWQRFSTDEGKKIQVVQYTHSAVDNTIPGDPSMTICIPSDQFGFGYTFVTPTGVATSYINYLTIITNDGSQNGFILDGQPVTGVTWNKVPNSNLVGGFVELDRSKQQFRIAHKIKGTTFQAYIYGSGDRESVAYPTGACIKALGECQTSTMFIADGKDNDCDGVIDEELFDGIDNDLDGKIDEDCYGKSARQQIDRCPNVLPVQACYGENVQLSCDAENTIKIVQAHFGNLGRKLDRACIVDTSFFYGGSEAVCPLTDISPLLRSQCDQQKQCSFNVTYSFLGDFALPNSCPVSFSYSFVQYTCLSSKEQNFGVLSGANYAASSWHSVSDDDNCPCLSTAFASSSGTNTESICTSCSRTDGSIVYGYYAAGASLNSNGKYGWRPANSDKDSSWLQLDLGGHHALGWYAISGCRKENSWIREFVISHSSDGHKWTEVRDRNDNLHRFDGNTDSINAKVCTLFDFNIVARFIRIHPLEYENAPCAHVDFGHNATNHGCKAPIVTNSNFDKGGSVGLGSVALVNCSRSWSTVDGERSYSVHCGLDGQWTASFRDCNIFLTCPDIPQIEDGYAIATSTLIGAKISYQCLIGRRLIGSATLTCLENGRWSDKAPTCEQL